jgi:uncharacterized protein (DUF433 family)
MHERLRLSTRNSTRLQAASQMSQLRKPSSAASSGLRSIWAVATASKAIPYAHITKDPKVCGGSACIDKTRIRVIDVVQAQSEGKTPEQIQEHFAVKLSLAQVYSALAYADENRRSNATAR